MLAYLEKVELHYDETTNEIVAPTFRHDIFRTADIAEEVARFYGYDNIPTTLPKGEATTGKLPFKLRIPRGGKRCGRNTVDFLRDIAILLKVLRYLINCRFLREIC